MAKRDEGGRPRVRGILKPSVGDEVEEELSFHVEMRVRELVAEGWSEADARAEALRRFGDLMRVKADCRRIAEERERSMRRMEFLAGLRQDVRYAFRQLMRSRAFAAAAVVMLALGIGATTAIFSVVDAVLLRSLPFPGAERLVIPETLNLENGDTWSVTYGDYLDWVDAGVFADVGLYQSVNVNISGGEASERVATALITGDFFAALGVAPVLGRLFQADDFVPGSPATAILSYGLWQRRFGGDRGIIGRSVRIAGVPTEVIAVLPRGLGFPRDVDLWLPLEVTPARRAIWERRDNFIFRSVARLAPGRTLEQTRSHLATLARQVERDHPDIRSNVTVTATPLGAWMVGAELSRALWLFLGAVVLVLLIGCVNVANLLLTRAAVRGRELAIRTALGAGRARIVRQLLTESVILALIGGAVGVAVAFWGVRVLVAAAPAEIPRLEEVALSPTALAFAAAVSLASAVLFGLAPALRASRGSPGAALGETSLRATAGAGTRRRRGALAAAELALSLVLLVAAGLVLRSFAQLRATDPGFETEGLLTFSLSLQGDRYDPDGVTASTFAELRRRMEAIPGIEKTAIVSSLPMGGGGFYLGRSFLAEGRPEPPQGEEVSGMWNVVSPDYFGTMRIPLLRGRDFSSADGAESTPVMIVNREFARRMFPDGDALGKRVRSWRDENLYREIVGIVGDVRFFGAGDEIRPLVYVPHPQNEWGSMVVVVRTAGDPMTVVGALRDAVRGLDPDLAVDDVQTMDQVFAASVAPRRFGSLLLGTFAGIAVVLAAIGIYGILSFGVTQRTREIGIRMALGARREDVLRMVVREAAVIALVGTVAGLAGALVVSRLLKSLLYQVSATDPVTFGGVVLLLIAVAVAASLAPARRAASVDPATTLRAE
ncbi:MAG TPA: ABC transporter permease [Longimicrobiales bacterium]